MMRTQGVMLRVREGGSLMTENYSFHLEFVSAGLETYSYSGIIRNNEVKSHEFII